MFVVLHNAHSSKQVEEFAKTIFGMGMDTLIITKAIGSAAQNGVPIAQKIALKLNKNLMFFEDIDDAVEILKPENVILIGNKEICNEKIDFSSIGDRDLVVFCGSSSGFTKKELEKWSGRYVVENDIAAIGEVAIFLYMMQQH
ncbi:MAG: hypothetical protein PWP15_1307 [Methanothermococcus sp.]|jgi:SpoU rRNA methylase family enzyme|uniref:RecB-family nuclease n=1 Tax=Methanothermococcus TaxID=155862 RepID=UPI0003706392|nr:MULTISPECIES: RecB-family nuclease [Methanothermococcus]MDK2790798.1 hypothetical protein [Methanothermococcus sp.]MDK2988019.1 hypothetical protein [Methanothermococcus sp.]